MLQERQVGVKVQPQPIDPWRRHVPQRPAAAAQRVLVAVGRVARSVGAAIQVAPNMREHIGRQQQQRGRGRRGLHGAWHASKCASVEGTAPLPTPPTHAHSLHARGRAWPEAAVSQSVRQAAAQHAAVRSSRTAMPHARHVQQDAHSCGWRWHARPTTMLELNHVHGSLGGPARILVVEKGS